MSSLALPVLRPASLHTSRTSATCWAVERDVYVEAIVPPNAWGEGWVTLTPAGTGTLAVTLQPDKEPADETDLVLVEAHDGVLSANATRSMER